MEGLWSEQLASLNRLTMWFAQNPFPCQDVMVKVHSIKIYQDVQTYIHIHTYIYIYLFIQCNLYIVCKYVHWVLALLIAWAGGSANWVLLQSGCAAWYTKHALSMAMWNWPRPLKCISCWHPSTTPAYPSVVCAPCSVVLHQLVWGSTNSREEWTGDKEFKVLMFEVLDVLQEN